jgi:CHAD domain-containing protein
MKTIEINNRKIDLEIDGKQHDYKERKEQNDLLCEALNKYAKEFGIECKDLKCERKKLRKKVRKFFTKNRQKIIDRIMHHAQAKLVEKNETELNEVVESYKNEMIKWKNIPIGRENFHEFRIALKKARYILEAQGEKVKDIVKLQTLLGDIHDLEVLTAKKGTTPRIQKTKLQELFCGFLI